MQRLLIFLSFIFIAQLVTAQALKPVAAKVVATKEKRVAFNEARLFDRLGDVDPSMRSALPKGSVISLNKASLQELLNDRPEAITLTLPLNEREVVTVELVSNNVLADDFSVKTSSGIFADGNYKPGLYYQGIVAGKTSQSLAAVSIFDDLVMGVIDIEGMGSYVLGPIDNDREGRYIFYRSEDLQHDMTFECGTDHLKERFDQENHGDTRAYDPNKCVRIYFECEYNMFQENGSSVQNTVDKMTGIYNVVKTLYNNDQINTVISEIFVWNTPDSYPTTSTSDALNAFRVARANNFNGDIAHLVSRGAPSGGGIAWLDVYCNKSYSFAYSYIYSTYEQLPTYSWTVMVIAHEMGHNLGSPHTHNCSWDVNNDGVASEMIDGCGPSAGYNEGSCPVAPVPSSGGTVMSYCHLTSAGINLNNGFGPLPGARIRNNVYNASCLTPCSACPVTINIMKTDVSCFGANNGSITVTGGGGTAPYTYAWSNGSNTSNLQNLAAGTYTVTVTDSGSNSCSKVASVTITQPAALNGQSAVTAESIAGANNGAINMTITGGTTPYSFLWNNGATSEDISQIPGGTYNLTVTDNKNCTKNFTIVVPTNSCSSVISNFPAQESFESGLGIFTQSTADNHDWIRKSGTTGTSNTGPSAAYQGTWYMFAKGNTPGTAIIESACLNILNRVNTSVSFAYSMYGSQIGSLWLEVSTNNGGTWTSIWSLSGNQGTGWKTATVSLEAYKTANTKIRFRAQSGGRRGDIAIDALTITALMPPCNAPVLSLSKTDLTCNSDGSGSATVYASGGAGNYTYAWSNSGNGTSISNLNAGTYTVTVTDGAQCSATGTIAIGEPLPILLQTSVMNASAPNAADGSINLTVSNGTGNIFYNWNTGATTQNISSLVPGTYSVTVTDGSYCSASTSAIVDVNPACDPLESLPYSESFENGFGMWTQSTADNFDWTRRTGSTPTGSTGPTSAADGSYYLYTEANDVSTNGAFAIIEGPCFNLNGISNGQFSFRWHMYGNKMGRLTLEISTNGGQTWSSLWTRAGNFSTAWQQQNISLASYANQTVKFRFKGARGSGDRSDMAIDNIQVTGGNAAPAGIILSEMFSFEGLYPNPASDNITLSVFSPVEKDIHVSLADVNGKTYDLGTIRVQSGEQDINVSLDSQLSGMFVFRLFDGITYHSKPIILVQD